MDALDRAISIAGGVTALARLVGRTQSAVSNWRLRGQVPPEVCIAIETATDESVTRHDLRPDIFGPPDQREAAWRTI